MGDSQSLLKNKEQASVLCAISTRSLDRLAKSGMVAPIKKGKSVRYIKHLLPNPDEARLLLKELKVISQSQPIVYSNKECSK